MAYLLDANVFIQASRLHYGFDFCPAFWDWLERENRNGKVFSIRQILDELLAPDDLTDWARNRGDYLFKLVDNDAMEKYIDVVNWVQTNGFKSIAVSTFMQVADSYLIAYALAHEHTVVTHEVPANTLNKVKIPNVCTGLGIDCINPFTMLRREGANFVLSGNAA